MQNPQVSVFLQQLESHYPAAFKRNYMLYSQIKTKGVLDDKKELIPWGLAIMIFIPITFLLQDQFTTHFSQFNSFQTLACAVLSIALFLMLVVPCIIKQIRHSSHSLYQLLRHSPSKLAVVIILQALNFVFLQSVVAVWILLFLTVSFGFVRFYKENLFREQSTSTDHYYLQQIRRICFWAYKMSIYNRFKLRLTPRQHPRHKMLEQQLNEFANLYVQLIKYEHDYCKKIKYIDIDSYLDDNL